MMLWILLLHLNTGYGGVSIVSEFTSYEKCEKAAEVMLNEMGWSSRGSSFVCVEK